MLRYDHSRSVQSRSRPLDGVNQPKLAQESALGLSTIVDFEKFRRHVSDEAVEAIRLALERIGLNSSTKTAGGRGAFAEASERAAPRGGASFASPGARRRVVRMIGSA